MVKLITEATTVCYGQRAQFLRSHKNYFWIESHKTFVLRVRIQISISISLYKIEIYMKCKYLMITIM